MLNTLEKMIVRSPWGKVQRLQKVTPFLTWVSTAGHGGCKVDKAFNARIPERVRSKDGWYEEDCAWCIPYVFLAGDIKAHNVSDHQLAMIGRAMKMLQMYYWKDFEVIFDVILPEGESFEKDEYLWKTRHAMDWCKIAASAVELGVKIWLTRGGRRGESVQEVVLIRSKEDYQSLLDDKGRLVLTDDQLCSITNAR